MYAHLATFVVLMMFEPGGFESFRCDIYIRSKSPAAQKRTKAEVVHHGPAFNIRGSPDRQQWLSPGASSSSCYTKSAESNLCSLNHMFLILLSQKVSPHEYQYILIS